MTTDLNTGSSLYDAHAAIDAALSQLDSVGRLGDADAVIQDVAGSTNYDAITADPDITSDAKLDRAALAYTKTMATVAQRLNRAAAIASTQHADDAAAVHGIVNPHLAASHRDATDRAAAIVDPRARHAALADALADNDDILARALVKSALANSDLRSVNLFSDNRPHLDKSLQRLWDAQHTKNDRRGFGLAAYNAKDALKPSAISSLAPFQIDARAQRKAAVQ